MISQTTTENLTYQRETFKLEILNLTNPPVITFTRKHSISKDGAEITYEMKDFSFVFSDVANKAVPVPDGTVDDQGNPNYKNITGQDVYLFIRTIGDAIDKF